MRMQAAFKNYCIDHNQILQSDRDPQILTVGGPNMPQTKPKFEKSQYLRNGTTDFDEIWYNDAYGPSRDRPNSQQISLFQKIQDGGDGHFENWKNCNISTT